MLFLLSPAKSLDYEIAVPSEVAAAATDPQFIGRSAELIATLRRHSVADIAALMSVSDALATLNCERYTHWSPTFTASNSKPAVLAFNGDVYGGLEAATLAPADLNWAQRHVAILSGLYGILRPLDRLQPYRLEMGTSLVTARGRNLYAYWGDTLAQYLNEQATADASPVLVNLASQEYFKAVKRAVLRPRVIECVFEEWKLDRFKVVSFFAKRARGLMARYAVVNRIATPAGLHAFNVEGYGFDAGASEPDRLVFRRRQDA